MSPSPLRPLSRLLPALLLGAALAACGDSGGGVGKSVGASSSSGGGSSSGSGGPSPQADCGDHPFPSAEWTACEQENFARTGEAPAEAALPAFAQRWQTQSSANIAEFTARNLADPSWLFPQSGNTPVTPVCATWGQQCVGDPFRYAAAAPSTDGQFYTDTATVTPVVFYDDGCARLSGRIWVPKAGTGPFPGVVIQNGSVQAPETVYWWAAQALVRQGYVVMTFDPRGQGRSDQQTPTGEQGSNAGQSVFWTGLVNAIDFFRSTAAAPYPHNTTCAGTYPTTVTNFNPAVASIDRSRLGIAGHSLGGIGVSVVQSYGAAGADAWPGKLDCSNPVDAVVAWDGLFSPASPSAGNAGGNTIDANPPGTPPPTVVAQFPVLGINGEYGLSPQPFTMPPDPLKTSANYRYWRDAGVPAVEMTIRGGTHYEFSLLPTFPATSWCPDPASGSCRNGWGNALTEYYTVAWFDRWLKTAGEIGFDDAEARLLDDASQAPKLSYYYVSARKFPLRNGQTAVCEDMRRGCN